MSNNQTKFLELASSIAVTAVALLIIFVLMSHRSRHRTVGTRISGGNIVRQVSFSLQPLATPTQPVGSFK